MIRPKKTVIFRRNFRGKSCHSGEIGRYDRDPKANLCTTYPIKFCPECRRLEVFFQAWFVENGLPLAIKYPHRDMCVKSNLWMFAS